MAEIIIGTYEGFLLGYSVDSEDGKRLKQTFATHSHTASVRCISTCGKFLASGGTDDKVVVIDLQTRKEHTVLMNHDGTINTVAFTNSGTHLLTGSDDGSIIITRTGNWQVEKIWKKSHGGQPVTAIAVHPTDKLALSIGGDKTLKTWNLIKGRPAFTINLASKGVLMPTEIKFSPGGDRFSLISQQAVDIWTIAKAGLEKRITSNSRPTCVQWITDEKLFFGLDNGNIITFTISDSQAKTYQGHKHRVKCLHYENNTLYSASSSGELKVWYENASKLTEICSVNASCRITCVTLNRQSNLIKHEEAPKDEESKSEEEYVFNDDNELETEKKPGAFVSISFERDNTEAPLGKKIKRKRRNKDKK